jgi:hypothetical protein
MRAKQLTLEELVNLLTRLKNQDKRIPREELLRLYNDEVKRLYPTRERKLSKCIGCENNFYNGNNTYGVKECWSLDTATIVKKKKVHIDDVPPWTQEPIEVLSCYHQKRYVFVNPDREG